MMRILFDQGTPSGIAKALSGHEVTEAIERGWEKLSNGELLAAPKKKDLISCSRRIRTFDISKT
jgi:hypothetical protein